jgi:SAM-dependent methyltransferase
MGSMSSTPVGHRLPMPPERLRFMRETDERFVATAHELADLVLEHAGPEARVLDVGSGYGRLAFGLVDRGFAGRYDGFDILPKHVAWCRKHLSPVVASLRFHHLDVRNARYNPEGRIDPTRARFPVNGSFDVVALFSVFTHMDRPSLSHYLAEIHRVLRPGGVAVSTFFLWDEARLDAITSSAAMYPMVHELDRDTRYMNAEDPLHAIAYRRSLVLDLIAEAGFQVEDVELGHWDGRTAPHTQDLVVFRRPATDRGEGGLMRSLRDRLGRR